MITCGAMLVQSLTGFGGALLALPLFALCLNVKQAVITFTLLQVVLNLILIIEARRHVQWKLVFMLLIGGLIGVPIGAYGLATLPTSGIRLIISVLTLIFGLLFLMNVKIRVRPTIANQVGTGLLSGLLGGAIAACGPPVTIYVMAQGWDKGAFRSTQLTIFTCVWAVASFSYLTMGLVTKPVITAFAFAIVPAAAASIAGLLLHRRISAPIFRLLTIWLIVLAGLGGLIRFAFHRGENSSTTTKPSVQQSAAVHRSESGL